MYNIQMYFMPLFEILGNFPVWSLEMNPSSLCTDIKNHIFFLFFGSLVGTEISSCIASVLSDFYVSLAVRPRFDFIVVYLVPCCICFM